MGNGADVPGRTAVSTARQAVRAELLGGPVGGCVEAGPAAQTGSRGAGAAVVSLGAAVAGLGAVVVSLGAVVVSLGAVVVSLGAAVAGLGAVVARLGAAGPSRAAARAHEQAIVRIFTLATSRRGFGGSTPGTDRG
jgi:hypothetical protein